MDMNHGRAKRSRIDASFLQIHMPSTKHQGKNPTIIPFAVQTRRGCLDQNTKHDGGLEPLDGRIASHPSLGLDRTYHLHKVCGDPVIQLLAVAAH